MNVARQPTSHYIPHMARKDCIRTCIFVKYVGVEDTLSMSVKKEVQTSNEMSFLEEINNFYQNILFNWHTCKI